jgi:hypothetical protein
MGKNNCFLPDGAKSQFIPEWEFCNSELLWVLKSK